MNPYVSDKETKQPQDKLGITALKEVQRLKYLRHKAWQNARQQRRRTLENKTIVRVRPDFWEQVARDYTCQIKAMQKGNY